MPLFSQPSLAQIQSGESASFIKKSNPSNYLGGKHDYDGCKMFKMDHDSKPLNSDSICMKENFNKNVTEPCQEYIYDNTYFDETLSIKFDLVCDNEHYRYVFMPNPSAISKMF